MKAIFYNLYARWIVFVELPAALALNDVRFRIKCFWTRIHIGVVRPAVILFKLFRKGYLRDEARRDRCLATVKRFYQYKHYVNTKENVRLQRELYKSAAQLQERLGTRINML